MRALGWAILACLSGPALADETGCYPWDGEVELSGILTEAIFPGRPDFSNVKRGDRPWKVKLLFVRESVCTIDDPKSPFRGAFETRVVQVLYRDSRAPFPNDLIGSSVRVRGTLIPLSSGFHWTPIMIRTDSIAWTPE